MNELLKWMERQADWYELVAKEAWSSATAAFDEDEEVYTIERARYAVYASVASDLRAKIIQFKAATA